MTLIVAPMTEGEARACVDAITGHIQSARVLILDLYERRGWEALGYASWRECVVAEFQSSQSYLYRQLAAAMTEREISPIGEIGTIPEGQLRELTGLTPDEQREVWQAAVESAPEGKVTAAHVREVAQAYKEPERPEWVNEDGEIVDAEPEVAPRSGGVPAALQMSVSNEWYTPAKYIEAARRVMGSIDLDPASNPIANQTVKAERYYTQDDDGLQFNWEGNVWMNPPYGRDGGESNQAIWSARLIEQYRAGFVTQAVMLVNAVTDRVWFAPLWDFPICFTDHRIKFYDESGEAGQPTHGNALVYLGEHAELFAEEFSKFGPVVTQVVRDAVDFKF